MPAAHVPLSKRELSFEEVGDRDAIATKLGAKSILGKDG